MQVKAFGMIIYDPHRVHYALYELGKYFKLPKNIDGYGVATSANDSVLLTRAPGRVEDNCLASLIGPLEGGCSVGQFRHKSDIRPFKASMSSANLGPYRYGNMAGVVTGGPENADKLGENRRNLLGILPDNFRKMVSGRTESEAFFYAVLSSLRSDFRLLEKKLLKTSLSRIYTTLSRKRNL